MLKRLTAAALVALLSATATPALARGQAHGSDKASRPAAIIQPQKPPQPGMVWANTTSGVYHREGSRYYGKTAKGMWMSEADAKAKGLRLAGSPGVKERPDPAPKADKPVKPAAKTGSPPAKPGKPPKPAKGH